MVDHRTEKEMEDLQTHVLLCAQRYEGIMLWLKILAILTAVNALGSAGPEILKLLIAAV